jgi:hypothetical protein
MPERSAGFFEQSLATSYPLPKPGDGPAPKPVVVPADQLRGVLGIRNVDYVAADGKVNVTDKPLV